MFDEPVARQEFQITLARGIAHAFICAVAGIVLAALAVLTIACLSRVAHANTVTAGLQRTGGECEMLATVRASLETFAKEPGHRVTHLTGDKALRLATVVHYDAPEFYVLHAAEHPEAVVVLGDDPGACTAGKGIYPAEAFAAMLEAAGIDGKDL